VNPEIERARDDEQAAWFENAVDFGEGHLVLIDVFQHIETRHTVEACLDVRWLVHIRWIDVVMHLPPARLCANEVVVVDLHLARCDPFVDALLPAARDMVRV